MVLDRMQADIQSYMKYGYPMATAIQMSVNKYQSSIPDVAKIEAANKAKATLTNAKTQAEIDKLNSEAKENLASIDKMKADSARAWAAGKANEATLGKYNWMVQWQDWKIYYEYVPKSWPVVTVLAPSQFQKSGSSSVVSKVWEFFWMSSDTSSNDKSTVRRIWTSVPSLSDAEELAAIMASIK